MPPSTTFPSTGTAPSKAWKPRHCRVRTGVFLRPMIAAFLAGFVILPLISAFPEPAQAGVETQDGRLKIGGDIMAPDLRPFLEAFETAVRNSDRSGSPLQVELNSVGGDIETAFFMADVITAAQRSGRVIKVVVPKGGRCHSSCVIIFAAGTDRRAAPDAEFMLHGVSYAGLTDSPGISAARQRYVEEFHRVIEDADWRFGQFVRRHGIIENDLNMTFSGRQLFEAFGGFITSLNLAGGN